jgi:HSP90 family molecular chaperone
MKEDQLKDLEEKRNQEIVKKHAESIFYPIRRVTEVEKVRFRVSFCPISAV